MNVSDERINIWAGAISETEEDKCQTAISQITDAIRDHFGYGITIVKQGSHRNRTNIRADSDVDIAVVHDSYYFPDIQKLSASDKLLHEQNSTDAQYKFSQFKSDVHSVLQKKFGLISVERKNKCIRVKGNSTRINADVVPAYGHKRFYAYNQIEAQGIGFVTDDSTWTTHSFPDQHYANGVSKNTATDRSYKAVVRILKNVRNELVAKNSILGDSMTSFFIESLVWNAPNPSFSGTNYRNIARDVIATIWADMRDPEKSKKYAEVSDLHWLFRGQRTPAQAEDFMLKAWHYLTP